MPGAFFAQRLYKALGYKRADFPFKVGGAEACYRVAVDSDNALSGTGVCGNA